MRKFLFTLVLLSFSIVFYAQDLYDLGVVKDIRLTFKQDNWAAILDHYKEDGKDKRLKATVIIDGVKYDSVGVRHKGNSSYFNVRKTGSSKLPFNIKVNRLGINDDIENNTFALVGSICHLCNKKAKDKRLLIIGCGIIKPDTNDVDEQKHNMERCSGTEDLRTYPPKVSNYIRSRIVDIKRISITKKCA